jgi:hypothetical protein
MSSTDSNDIPCQVTFPDVVETTEQTTEQTTESPENEKSESTNVADIIMPMTEDCANMMTNTTEHSASELKSRILYNMKVMDDIQRKVKEARATFKQDNKSVSHEPTVASTNTIFSFTNVLSTVQERFTTIHKKDLTQHANIIRDDVMTFLELIPKNDVGDKLKSILNAK